MGTGAKLAVPAGPAEAAGPADAAGRADAVARWDLAAGVARVVSTKATAPTAARAAPATASEERRCRRIQPVSGRVGAVPAPAAPPEASETVSLPAGAGRGTPGCATRGGPRRLRERTEAGRAPPATRQRSPGRTRTVPPGLWPAHWP